MRKWSLALLAAVLVAPTLPPAQATAATTYEMLFPVVGDYYYGDTWGAARSNNRTHQGTDIMTYGVKGVPVVAVASGTVGWMHNEQGGDCCAMALHHDDGWTSWYIHLNNDTPGTDDGQGWGFAPGIATGVHVEAGDVIGFVGDSGNAEQTAPHLHFELHEPDGTSQGNPINPYPHLVAAEQDDIDDTPIGWFEEATDEVDAVRMRGWTLDPDLPDPIYAHIYVDGTFKKGLLADGPRADVERVHENGRYHGFDLTFPLEPGSHRICVYAINEPTRSGNPQIGCKTVTISSEVSSPPPPPEPGPEPNAGSHIPFGWVDSVDRVENQLQVRGWAIDEDDPGHSVGIHVYVDGRFAFGGRADSKRGDVDNAFGLGAYHGFDFGRPIDPGSHTVCVYAINHPSRSNNPKLGCEVIG